jgi:anionic cell wall polymer biosynthesis LytR-Cps2A-Psr (LCP) family protein
VVLTVEELTGLSIPYAAVVQFDGVIELADALGGVDVCVAEEINDDFTQTYLTAGNHTLSGIAALQFLRTRHGVGDGSDLSRISNQQVFLSALVRKLKSEGTLTNPLTLYNLAKAAVSNLTLSESLNNVDTMVSIAMALRSIPLDRVVFVQYPGSTGGEGIYLGKVAPKQEAADELFAALIADLPIALGGDTGAGSIKSGQIATDPVPTAAPRPTGTSTAVPTAPPVEVLPEPVVLSGQLLGQNAGEVTCSKGNN